MAVCYLKKVYYGLLIFFWDVVHSLFFAKKSARAREIEEQVVEYPFSKSWCCGSRIKERINGLTNRLKQFLGFVMSYMCHGVIFLHSPHPGNQSTGLVTRVYVKCPLAKVLRTTIRRVGKNLPYTYGWIRLRTLTHV